MAVPTVLGRNTGSSGGSSSFAITFDTTPNVGDLLVVEFVGGIAEEPLTAVGSGWTKAAEVGSGSAGTTTPGAAVFYKTANGSDSLTINASASGRGMWLARRISGGGWAGIQTAGGTSTSADPPANSPGIGTKDFLWIAGCAVGSATLPSAAPSGYSNFTTFQSVGGGQGAASAEKTATAVSTENPAAFTNPSAAWAAWTIAINDNSPTGTTYNDTVAEGITAAHSTSTAATFSSSVAEAATTSASVATVAVFGSSLAENVAANDTESNAATWPNALAESATVSDTLAETAQISSSLSETVAADYSVTGTQGAQTYNDTLNEAVTAALSLTPGQMMAAGIAEAIIAGDALDCQATLASSLAEAIVANDNEVGAGAWQAGLPEGLTSADAYAGVAISGAALTVRPDHIIPGAARSRVLPGRARVRAV